MRSSTSGLMCTRYKNGSVRLEVVDYAVDMFGGRDWESWYELDKENAKLLFKELRKSHKGSFEEMLTAEFDKTFDTLQFDKFCKEHNIVYRHMTWS